MRNRTRGAIRLGRATVHDRHLPGLPGETGPLARRAPAELNYPGDEAVAFAACGGGVPSRRLSWLIQASASASEVKPSIVCRAPLLPAIPMLNPEPSGVGMIVYVVIPLIYTMRIRIASHADLALQKFTNGRGGHIAAGLMAKVGIRIQA